MIIVTNNCTYKTNDGEIPLNLEAPWYLIFYPTNAPLRYTDFEYTETGMRREDIRYLINPWTYWNNETKLDSIRLQRDYLLQQTDWRAIRAYETQTPESQDWLDYRQALRDFPQTVNVNLPIQQIVWPVPPS